MTTKVEVSLIGIATVASVVTSVAVADSTRRSRVAIAPRHMISASMLPQGCQVGDYNRLVELKYRLRIEPVSLQGLSRTERVLFALSDDYVNCIPKREMAHGQE
jgi:hypothetical protein